MWPCREKMSMAPLSPKVKQKYLVDVALAISFLVCFVTGIVKLPGFTRFFHRAAVEMPTDMITAMHDGSGILLGLFTLVHLYLNRRWIASVTRRLLEKP
jgi:cytochrome b subunit of formate dehydrogenase